MIKKHLLSLILFGNILISSCSNPLSSSSSNTSSDDSSTNSQTTNQTTTNNQTTSNQDTTSKNDLTSNDSTSKNETTQYNKITTPYTNYTVNKTFEYNTLESVGEKNILVLPIEIKGYTGTDTILSDIKKVFNGTTQENGFVSVHDYYYQSSYGQLDLNFIVADYWYKSNKTPTDIDNGSYTDDYGDTDTTYGVTTLIKEAVEYYRTNTANDNLKSFDKDSDGYIDGIWAIYSCPNYYNVYQETGDYSLSDNFWAFVYYDWVNIGNNNLDKPIVNIYGWASYDFMYEGYGKTKVDSHTFDHETGHMLGLDDYYDYGDDYGNATSPFGGLGMMDLNILDHDAYSKFSSGWIKPYLIDKEGTITIKPITSSGEAVIIPTKKGSNNTAFDEYLILELYTPDGLNKKDSDAKYPGNNTRGYTDSGVRVFHVDSRLVKQSGNSYTYVDTIDRSTQVTVGQSNTASYNYVNDNFKLIQIMDATNKEDFGSEYLTSDNSSLFKAGDSFTFSEFKNSFYYSTKMNNGYKLAYNFEVKLISSEGATIQFTSNN